MKVSSMLFSAAIAGLTVAYCSLYVEYINLQSQLEQLQPSSAYPENSSLQEATFTNIHQQSETVNNAVKTDASRSLGKIEQSASFQLQEKNLKILSEKKYNILFSILRLSGSDRDQIA